MIKSFVGKLPPELLIERCADEPSVLQSLSPRLLGILSDEQRLMALVGTQVCHGRDVIARILQQDATVAAAMSCPRSRTIVQERNHTPTPASGSSLSSQTPIVAPTFANRRENEVLRTAPAEYVRPISDFLLFADDDIPTPAGETLAPDGSDLPTYLYSFSSMQTGPHFVIRRGTDLDRLATIHMNFDAAPENFPNAMAFIRRWRNHFLRVMQPKYLPEFWGIDAGIS